MLLPHAAQVVSTGFTPGAESSSQIKYAILQQVLEIRPTPTLILIRSWRTRADRKRLVGCFIQALMIQLNYFIRPLHNGNVVPSCRWIENGFLSRFVNNLIISLALWRKWEGAGWDAVASETKQAKEREAKKAKKRRVAANSGIIIVSRKIIWGEKVHGVMDLCTGWRTVSVTSCYLDLSQS